MALLASRRVDIGRRRAASRQTLSGGGVFGISACGTPDGVIFAAWRTSFCARRVYGCQASGPLPAATTRTLLCPPNPKELLRPMGRAPLVVRGRAWSGT